MRSVRAGPDPQHYQDRAASPRALKHRRLQAPPTFSSSAVEGSPQLGVRELSQLARGQLRIVLRARRKRVTIERHECVRLDPFAPDVIAFRRQPERRAEHDARSVVLRKRRQHRPGAERRFPDQLRPSVVTKRRRQDFGPGRRLLVD